MRMHSFASPLFFIPFVICLLQISAEFMGRGFREGLDEHSEDLLQQGFNAGVTRSALARFAEARKRGMLSGLALMMAAQPAMVRAALGCAHHEAGSKRDDAISSGSGSSNSSSGSSSNRGNSGIESASGSVGSGASSADTVPVVQPTAEQRVSPSVDASGPVKRFTHRAKAAAAAAVAANAVGSGAAETRPSSDLQQPGVVLFTGSATACASDSFLQHTLEAVEVRPCVLYILPFPSSSISFRN